MLERKLADSQVSEEEQNDILKHLDKKETEYMRRQRRKMGADDFEPLTMIGKGAFGEVSLANIANFNLIGFAPLFADTNLTFCRGTG